MISIARVRFIRMSPRKMRLVADLVRGKPIDQARATLMNTHKRASFYISQLLLAAVANAKRDPEISETDLYISKIMVDGGPMLKRFRAGSMGRAMMIRHRTSHILMELDLKKRAVKAAQSAGESPKSKTKIKTEAEAKKAAPKIKAAPKAKKDASAGAGASKRGK